MHILREPLFIRIWRYIILLFPFVLSVSATPNEDVSAGQRNIPAFSLEQVSLGSSLYEQHCTGCHGADLGGAGASALVDVQFLNKWTTSNSTLGKLYEAVAIEMPANAPGVLSAAQGEAVLAFILKRNGYSEGGGELRASALDFNLAKPSNKAAVRIETYEPDGPPPIDATSFKLASSSHPTDADILNSNTDGWLLYNRTLDGIRYSPLKEISKRNVKNIHVQCIAQLGEIGSFQSGLLVWRGKMYVTTPHSTYAFNATNCQRLWRHTYQPSGHQPWLANRGVALYKGSVFRGTTDGHLLALDAMTGELLWDSRVADSSKGGFISGVPVAIHDKVFVGEAGADWGWPGHVHAYDYKTGKRLWTFDVIPTGEQPGADTWEKGAETGGGSMWTTLTYDQQSNNLYVSVGNPAPDYYGAARPGDNLYTNSVVVLDADTGALQWYSQLLPHDVHDWNLAASPTLFSSNGRQLLSVAGKDGYIYLIDREKKSVERKQPVSRHKNTDIAPTTEGIHTCPGPVGGVEWNGVAYDPRQSSLYVNSVDWCATFTSKEPNYIPGAPYTGGTTSMDAKESAHGWLRSFRASDLKPLWKYQSPTPMVAAVTPTAGDILFTGDLNGRFMAFDSSSGELLYEFNTGGAIAGGVITYAEDGKQYVATTSGNSSRTVWKTTGSSTIIVFALDHLNGTQKVRKKHM